MESELHDGCSIFQHDNVGVGLTCTPNPQNPNLSEHVLNQQAQYLEEFTELKGSDAHDLVQDDDPRCATATGEAFTL